MGLGLRLTSVAVIAGILAFSTGASVRRARVAAEADSTRFVILFRPPSDSLARTIQLINTVVDGPAVDAPLFRSVPSGYPLIVSGFRVPRTDSVRVRYTAWDSAGGPVYAGYFWTPPAHPFSASAAGAKDAPPMRVVSGPMGIAVSTTKPLVVTTGFAIPLPPPIEGPIVAYDAQPLGLVREGANGRVLAASVGRGELVVFTGKGVLITELIVTATFTQRATP